jgi:hypothetical protein
VPQSVIRRLYESDARGIYDDDLLDEVGWSLRARCQSFVAAMEAVRGRAACPCCGTIVPHRATPDEVLRCPTCQWQEPWPVYFKTIQHNQLSGAGPVLALFQDFVDRFPSAEGPREKMLLIDSLIHGFHWQLGGEPTRTTGINLIEGRYHDVVEFLDGPTYGEGSTLGTRETLAEWRRTIDATAARWDDRRLRR